LTPLFFGSSERRLFGIHHEAQSKNRARHAVLLCYPGAQEYNGAHWAFRRFARMLSRAGHDVLRFDYFGTGDSAGESEEGRPDLWVENVIEAASELREIAQARSLSVVGMRLGATLALRACARGLKAKALLLWDPVVSGRDYVRELEDFDKRRNIWLLHADRLDSHPDELFGYTFPEELRASLRELDACAKPAPQAERVVIATLEQRLAYTTLKRSLDEAGVPTSISVVTESGAGHASTRERTLLSNAILVRMVDELNQELS
jgi:pimeloyl-ACP methyl ester carboxylesterase